MKLRVLGSGTSTGVPEIGCTCQVCTSTHAKDKRLRSSVLIENHHQRILIDCGPDLRAQMLPLPFEKLDAVLITHDHYDHVSGLDDLRPISRLGEIPVFVESNVSQSLCIRMPYCFVDRTYPGAPKLTLHLIAPNLPFYIGDMKVMPLRVMHGNTPIVGYRIDDVAYITDMTEMPESNYKELEGIHVLLINALRKEPHPTHQTLDKAIEVAQRIGAKQTYFIHMSHQVGLHNEVERSLPQGMHLAYDGLIIDSLS